MDWKLVSLALTIAASCWWHNVDATCVLDSDFGFTLNCGFKKSTLFRVRNLGGVKGHVGFGFSVGDELGFPQSLSTTDVDAKRRSVQGVRSNNVGVRSSNVGVRSNSVEAATPIKTKSNGVQTVTSVNGIKRNSVNRSSSNKVRAKSARQVTFTIPPFKPILPATVKHPQNSPPQYQHLAPQNSPSLAPSFGDVEDVPVFQALPSSITKLTSVPNVKTSQPVGVKAVPVQQAFRNSLKAATSHFQVRKDALSPTYDHGLAENTLTLRTLNSSPAQQNLPSDDLSSTAYFLKPEDSIMGHSIQALAQASNLSVEAITAAIAVRQQQLFKQQQQAPITTTTTSEKPDSLPSSGNTKKYPLSSISKVMNAPKEYYPVGYDKNFDDNFASRVELPDTSFYCGDQKHFPGLYGDEDLGCMVFHVCAFTDDGLIMKSFLCPESTLFDQTILKCNWWFYVDCKSSAKLYDSNIPISKSYQLMKALAFFSTYKKNHN